MNFHPDKQLFQVAATGDRTTDPWITRPVLYPYTTGTHCCNDYWSTKTVQLVTLKLRNPYVSHSLKIATVDIWIRYIEVYSTYIACLVERKSQY